jgi:hypothetical protein
MEGNVGVGINSFRITKNKCPKARKCGNCRWFVNSKCAEHKKYERVIKNGLCDKHEKKVVLNESHLNIPLDLVQRLVDSDMTQALRFIPPTNYNYHPGVYANTYSTAYQRREFLQERNRDLAYIGSCNYDYDVAENWDYDVRELEYNIRIFLERFRNQSFDQMELVNALLQQPFECAEDYAVVQNARFSQTDPYKYQLDLAVQTRTRKINLSFALGT